jgi:short-subunit dehydrogenase
MKTQLKELAEQVIVITGASSGIGLTTARMAAERGARLVLVARNGEALETIAGDLRALGAEVIHVVADVGHEDEVRAVARKAIEHFGGFDTWVNNAGVSIFGRNEEVSREDQRRLFDTNFWGVVHGSLAAVEHLKKKGGALINLGSEVSDASVPLQGMYAASKHAVKGFTDSLRIELMEEGAPVSVTLIKPAAIDTMFVPHAKNYMDVEPKLPPPIYAPDLVANAILTAAQHPHRDIFVGGASKMASATAHHAPAVLDSLMTRMMFKQQRSDQPAGDRDDNSLYSPAPGTDGRERQGYKGIVFESAPYTAATLHPRTTAVAIGAGLALLALWQGRQGSQPLRRKPRLMR